MRFLNTSDLMDPDWRFLASVSKNPALIWEAYSGRPRNVLERSIPRPHIGRWRAALSASRAARNDPEAVLVSHLPTMAAATNRMRKLVSPKTPQIAFAFNFTDLPQGARLAYFRRAFEGIREFVVFSRFEQALYADLFGIPKERFRFLPWAMEPPKPGPENPLPDDLRHQGYICAIGGEGRDYALLAETMRKRPDLNLALVARPYSIEGIRFPQNVTVFTNLPQPLTWRLALESRGLVIPLKTEETACGHITMVGAQLLGLPLVVTRSRGVADYVDEDVAQIVPARDETAMLAALDRLREDPMGVESLAQAGQTRARARNTLQNWVDYFEALAAELKAAA